jgi:hypothetical protein
MIYTYDMARAYQEQLLQASEIRRTAQPTGPQAGSSILDRISAGLGQLSTPGDWSHESSGAAKSTG